MSIQVTWPRTTSVSDEERLLRRIFEHIGADQSLAESAALLTMVERYGKTKMEGAE